MNAGAPGVFPSDTAVTRMGLRCPANRALSRRGGCRLPAPPLHDPEAVRAMCEDYRAGANAAFDVKRVPLRASAISGSPGRAGAVGRPHRQRLRERLRRPSSLIWRDCQRRRGRCAERLAALPLEDRPHERGETFCSGFLSDLDLRQARSATPRRSATRPAQPLARWWSSAMTPRGARSGRCQPLPVADCSTARSSTSSPEGTMFHDHARRTVRVARGGPRAPRARSRCHRRRPARTTTPAVSTTDELMNCPPPRKDDVVRRQGGGARPPCSRRAPRSSSASGRTITVACIFTRSRVANPRVPVKFPGP